MVNKGVIGGGISLLIVAGIGYYALGTYEGFTYPQLNDFYNSGILQCVWTEVFGKAVMGINYMEPVAQQCENTAIIMLPIYAVGIAGLIVIGVGSMMKGEKKKDETSLEILKERYAKGEISKEEFEKMKKDLENS